MQIQRISACNYGPQFNGQLTVKKQERGRDSYVVAKKEITPEDDKRLYDIFVELIGEEPGEWASNFGGTGVDKSILIKYLSTVNNLLGTDISMEPKDNENLFRSYSSDGQGGLKYDLGFLSDPYTIKHELTREVKPRGKKNKHKHIEKGL